MACAGLGVANAFIARDEAMHRDFAILLYTKLENKLSFEHIKRVIESAVDVEEVFVRESIPVSLLGINADDMVAYVKFVANHLSVSLQYPPVYTDDEARNPFDFMDMLSLSRVSKTNFFELQNDAYAATAGGDTAEERSFSLEEDF